MCLLIMTQLIYFNLIHIRAPLKAASQNPAQFHPASDVSEEKNKLNTLPSIQREATFVLHTNQRNVFLSFPDLSPDFITKMQCRLRWVTGAAVQHMPSNTEQPMSPESEGCSIPTMLKGKL